MSASLAVSVGTSMAMMTSCTSPKNEVGSVRDSSTGTTVTKATNTTAPKNVTESSTVGIGDEDPETIVSATVVPTTEFTLPPLAKSPAELDVLAPTTSGRLGSIDNDSAAAAPDTRVLERSRPVGSAAPPPDTLPIVTAPDLGLDPAEAEKLMVRATWPAGLVSEKSTDADSFGNSVASAFAGDRQLLAALRSGSGRLLRTPENQVVVAAIVLLTPEKLSGTPEAAVRRVFAGAKITPVAIDGKELLMVVPVNGFEQLVYATPDRLLSAAGLSKQTVEIRGVMQSLLTAAS
jgi:hypothetical protein